MTTAGARGSQVSRELGRIVNFSDGVFAIVITLLILTIEIPAIPHGLVAEKLPEEVFALGPKFLSYMISFFVVAIYWMAHHGTFEPIKAYDRRLLWLNFLFLMTISFIPFPTSLLGEYSGQQLPVVIYALNVSAASLLLLSISWYSTSGHRLTDEDVDEGSIRYRHIRALSVPIVFMLSIAISFFSVYAAMYSWILLFVANPILRRL